MTYQNTNKHLSTQTMTEFTGVYMCHLSFIHLFIVLFIHYLSLSIRWSFIGHLFIQILDHYLIIH